MRTRARITAERGDCRAISERIEPGSITSRCGAEITSAIKGVIDLLTREHGLSPISDYCLTGVAFAAHGFMHQHRAEPLRRRVQLGPTTKNFAEAFCTDADDG